MKSIAKTSPAKKFPLGTAWFAKTPNLPIKFLEFSSKCVCMFAFGANITILLLSENAIVRAISAAGIFSLFAMIAWLEKNVNRTEPFSTEFQTQGAAKIHIYGNCKMPLNLNMHIEQEIEKKSGLLGHSDRTIFN